MNEKDEERLTREEASRHFAVAFNRMAWRLLETRYREPEETARMIHAAHASYLHWLEAGTAVNWQRGAWLLSRVYAETGHGEMATVYAAECRQLYEAHPVEMSDFDTVYVLEAEARALAVSGDLDTARELFLQARGTADLVADEDDRKFVLSDIASGNWGDLALPD